MRILHVVHKMDPRTGGVAEAVRTMIVGLSSNHAINEVVSLDSPGEIIGFVSIKINAMGPGKSPWAYSKRLKIWLDENISRFDVVIVHGMWLYYGFAVYKLINRLKKRGGIGNLTSIPKLFLMPHGMLDPYFQKAKGRKLKAIRNFFYWKYLEGKIVHACDALLFTCEEECRLAAKTFRPYAPKKQMIVGLGVEQPPAYTTQMTEDFYRKNPGVEGQRYVLFLGRIHEKKGVDLLIQAYSKMVQGLNESIGKRPVRDFNHVYTEKDEIPKLLIAGPGLDSPYGRYVQEIAGKANLTNTSIFFSDMLSGNEKWGAFYNCEAFVLPSFQENFGIVVVEALACSKPVLITSRVNIWREIYNEGCAIISDVSQEGIRQMLEEIASLTYESKKEIAVYARTCYLQQFSVEHSSLRLLRAIGN